MNRELSPLFSVYEKHKIEEAKERLGLIRLLMLATPSDAAELCKDLGIRESISEILEEAEKLERMVHGRGFGSEEGNKR